jgi:DNA uptake protein ComE-like DNA-binding protein
VLAKRVVDDRQRNGDFITIQDLARVHGIGPKTIDRIKVYCREPSRPQPIMAQASP